MKEEEYHDFSSTKDATEMLISTGKFRRQMQAIKDLGLNVISLEDFTALKRGEKTIEDRSVLITIDDGWKSIYTDAFPILKEMGFPFTVFLYTNYINGGSNALTTSMIKKGGKEQALSPECTPASSICCMIPATCTWVPSQSASTSISTAPER